MHDQDGILPSSKGGPLAIVHDDREFPEKLNLSRNWASKRAMITIKRVGRIERAVVEAGYQYIINCSETVVAPIRAEAFAAEAI